MLARHILTHTFQHIHMGPTKSCGSHIHLVGPMWILTNQRECVEKYVLKCVLLAFLYKLKEEKGMQLVIKKWLKTNINKKKDLLKGKIEEKYNSDQKNEAYLSKNIVAPNYKKIFNYIYIRWSNTMSVKSFIFGFNFFFFI